ncbi:MAG: phosphoglycerate kinase, partial [Rikenellaceae bacterium]
LAAIDSVMEAPQRPFTAIVGGAKVSSKITIIEKLMDKVDKIIIGGGMTFTFEAAKGGKIGSSLCEPDMYQVALDIIKKAEEKGVQLVLSSDTLAADKFDAEANAKVVPGNDVPEGWLGLDLGPAGIEEYVKVVLESKTILWNGPVGVFEFEKFAAGSKAVAEAIAEATSKGAYSLIGGGDSVACINKLGLASQVSYVSTGGGALLEYMEGKVLPGVAAIRS